MPNLELLKNFVTAMVADTAPPDQIREYIGQVRQMPMFADVTDALAESLGETRNSTTPRWNWAAPSRWNSSLVPQGLESIDSPRPPVSAAHVGHEAPPGRRDSNQ